MIFLNFAEIKKENPLFELKISFWNVTLPQKHTSKIENNPRQSSNHPKWNKMKIVNISLHLKITQNIQFQPKWPMHRPKPAIFWMCVRVCVHWDRTKKKNSIAQSWMLFGCSVNTKACLAYVRTHTKQSFLETNTVYVHECHAIVWVRIPIRTYILFEIATERSFTPVE